MHVNSCILLFEILWTVTHQSPLYVKFYRQEYGSGLPCPPPGDLTHPRNKPPSPALQADALLLNQQGSPINLSVSKSINKSVYPSTSYWLCYFGESSLIQWFKRTQLEIKSYDKVLINSYNSYFMN